MGKSKQNNKHIVLRKMGAGLMITCFVIFVFGQISAGVSAKSILLWSSILLFALGVAFQVILRLWISWEEINQDSARK